MHEKLKSFKNEDVEEHLPTPPATPSPPKLRALPPKSNMEKHISNQLSPRQETTKRLKGVRKRRISELKVDEDLSPKTKRRKIRQRTRSVVNSVCGAKGESLGSILGECCVNGEKTLPKHKKQYVPTFDIMVKEKGPRAAFAKLLSEETLNARAQSMRVPDQTKARPHQFDETWKNRGKLWFQLYFTIVNILTPLASKIAQFETWRKEIMLKYQARCGILSIIFVTSLFHK